MTSQTHECIKAFSGGDLRAIRDNVEAYELLVSSDLIDPLYTRDIKKLNVEIQDNRDRQFKIYEDDKGSALQGSVVRKPIPINRPLFRKKFQIIYGLFQRKGLIIRKEVFADL